MNKNFVEIIAFINDNQPIKSDCGDFTVINTGTSTATINGLSIAPGSQYVSYANEGEINKTIYIVAFDNSGTNQCTIIRKVYN